MYTGTGDEYLTPRYRQQVLSKSFQIVRWLECEWSLAPYHFHPASVTGSSHHVQATRSL
jgi:hypothetical protein